MFKIDDVIHSWSTASPSDPVGLNVSLKNTKSNLVMSAVTPVSEFKSPASISRAIALALPFNNKETGKACFFSSSSVTSLHIAI